MTDTTDLELAEQQQRIRIAALERLLAALRGDEDEPAAE
jgi:hypothetical protein